MDFLYFFFNLFIYFLIFLKKIKNLPRVKLTSCHVSLLYQVSFHFLILNLVPVF